MNSCMPKITRALCLALVSISSALWAYDPQTADIAKVRADAKGVSAQGAFAVDIGTGLDAFVRPSVSLNGEWSSIVDQQDFGAAEFYKDLKQDGVKLVQHDFDAAPKMRVPTDWNSVDKTLLYYEGAMWLRRTFERPALPGRRTVLRFGAVNYKADVWLNGKMLGSHEGGFTPFGFDVTDVLTNGLNSLVVRADSTRRAESIPCQAFDWWNYGGITRDVVLFDLPETYLAEGVLQCAKGKPEVLEGVVRASVRKAGLVATVAVPELGLRAEAKTDANGCARFTLAAKPELWSPENPRLYDVTFALGGDVVRDRIGFRTVEVKGKKILLNGRQVFFKGICFHDEKLGGGRINRAEDVLPQLKLAKELGCNFLRLAHYPHNEATVREAERQGFMVWSEIPVYWNIKWENEATYANAERQLCDMVRRDANRAAVVVWSLANETPYGAPRDKFLSSLAKKARQLDVTRIISMAMEIGDVKDHVCTITDTLNPYVDIVSFNQYIAWYWASAKEAAEFTFKIPYDKPVVISEFGGGAVCGRHGPKEERWTEEYQAELYRANLAMLAKIDGLSGLTPWILNDFRSPRRPCPGIQDGYNRKGLVSEKGEKKLAFDVVRDFYRSIGAAATAAKRHEVSAWRGEALVFSFDHVPADCTTAFTPRLEGLPAGYVGKIGLARPIKFERTPNSGEFVAACDRVMWDATEPAMTAGRPRKVVVEVKIPADAKPGKVAFTAAGEPVELTVVDRVLPPPKDWKYFLDLWQHPWAVSRWEGVEPFSKAHYDAMRPLWKALADCGQKVVTATITKLPWNHQCHDGYDTTIRHIRKADGTWTFDYSVFDEYVAFCFDCGIGPYVSCYTMVPWGYYVYGETEDGKELKILAKPGTKEFEDYWKPFLTDFTKHLKAKGWLGRTYISMDERAPEDMRKISQFIAKYGEGLKIATAGNFDPSTMPDLKLDNYSPVVDTVTDKFLANNLEQRRKAGCVTTYYVCCVPYKPNTFMDSDPAEAFWCGFFPAAKGLDGFLRWAYNSWPYDPRHDASYGNWRAGDTYFIYQDATPSIRLLELRNGIQAAEKFRILKEEGKMNAALEALAKKYDFISARKDETDLNPLKAETLKVVNAPAR